MLTALYLSSSLQHGEMQSFTAKAAADRKKRESDVADCRGSSGDKLLIWFPVLLSSQCKVASVLLIAIPLLIPPFISSPHSPLKVNYL